MLKMALSIVLFALLLSSQAVAEDTEPTPQVLNVHDLLVDIETYARKHGWSVVMYGGELTVVSEETQLTFAKTLSISDDGIKFKTCPIIFMVQSPIAEKVMYKPPTKTCLGIPLLGSDEDRLKTVVLDAWQWTQDHPD